MREEIGTTNRMTLPHAAAIALCVIVILSISSAQLRGATLEQQFAASISAKGADYVAIQERIVSKNAESLPFLRSKLNDSEWRVRVVAEAIIAHIEDPETYSRCEEIMMTIGGPRLRHSRPSFYDGTGGTVFSPYPLRGVRVLIAEVRSRYKEASWLWFLAEIAMKDSVLMKPIREFQMPDDDPTRLYTIDQVADILQVSRKAVDRWTDGLLHVAEERNGEKQIRQDTLGSFAQMYLKPDSSTQYREKVRCWAMLTLSSFSDDPVVIPLLTELLQPHESTKIRGYAALALGASGDPRAIEPLANATDDPDRQVKEAAQRSLSRLYEIIEELKRSEGSSKE